MPLSLDEAGQLLRRSVFFRSVLAPAIQELARHAKLVRLPAGELLFKKGDPGSTMYFIVEGRVRVHHAGMDVMHLEGGEVFGEVAALSGQVRTASVSAGTDTVLLQLEQAAIYAALASHPDAARSMIEALCQRESEVIGEKIASLVQARVLETEFEIGQKIQQNFLPSCIPAMDGWQLDGMLRPARKVAGDFYDFFMIPKLRCMGVVIGDVCDKGVGAALFMTLFRSLIRSGALYGSSVERNPDADDLSSALLHIMHSTNQYIALTHSGSSMFASVFLGLIVPETGHLRYINAGHEAPWIGNGSAVRTQLPPTGPVLGLFDQAEYRIGSAEVLPGEVFFAYTDGASDALNEAGQAFSEALLRSTFTLAAAGPGAVLEAVSTAIKGFIGKAEQFDDITMISARRNLY